MSDKIEAKRVTRQIGNEAVVVVSDKMRNFRTECEVQRLEHDTRECRMATILIEKWGMVSGEPDGEDSVGRAKLKLMTPADVVARACETTEIACAEFRKRGWIVPVSPVYELDDEYAEKYGDD